VEPGEANTLVWTAAAAPLGYRLFFARGLFGLLRVPQDRVLVLAAWNWLILAILRALPHTPGHNGIRQFLPAFGMLALIAGSGVSPPGGPWVRAWKVASVVEVAVAVAIAAMHLLPLSYFSPLVGGLPGAARLGFEPTYYWDTLTPVVLDRATRHTDYGRSISFMGRLIRTGP
jgi:hypothetical protein